MTDEDNDLNDPEDAYDITDPPRERLRNFVRRLDWLMDHVDLSTSLNNRFERLREDLVALRDEMDD
jgi:hypothetical protein